MVVSAKQLPFEEASGLLGRVREQGKTVVQCHGTFDLVHPGHIIHFEEAKALGDVLVVTITAEQFVNKGPGRPYFNDSLRVKSIAALECVDYVVIVPYAAAVEAIECVRPDIYCKGKEYADTNNDVTGNIQDDLKTVERVGGKVAYVGSLVFSSTRLLNRNFDPHSSEVREFCERLSEDVSAQQFRDLVESFTELKVLVIGDIIFDRYTAATVQGLTSKNRIMSARFVDEDLQAGGALAVMRHIREFTPNVKLISLAGTEPWVEAKLSEYVAPDEDEILRVPNFTTVVKQRFVEPLSQGKELLMLFSVNYIDERHPGAQVQETVCRHISEHIKDCDLVVAMDFGHGLMGDSVRSLVQEQSPFLAVNCQTNSNNYGFNVISRQYQRADSFSLDQRELQLACGVREPAYSKELSKLREHFSSAYAWLTRGAVETIGLGADGTECRCPPFELNVVDTVGAGDAFCAVASLCAARRLPVTLGTFMGQVAGAQAVRTVGNTEPVRKSGFLKSGMAMLTY